MPGSSRCDSVVTAVPARLPLLQSTLYPQRLLLLGARPCTLVSMYVPPPRSAFFVVPVLSVQSYTAELLLICAILLSKGRSLGFLLRSDGCLQGFPRQPKRPGATESPSPEAKHASGSPFHRSTSRSVTSSPPAGAVGSNPNIGAQTQQPLLRFRSDNHFETSQELVARAERQNRQRAELDAQIAEKQARLEAEQAEVLTHQACAAAK